MRVWLDGGAFLNGIPYRGRRFSAARAAKGREAAFCEDETVPGTGT